MKSKHTSGPWIHDRGVVQTSVGHHVASVMGQYKGGYYSAEETDANATLIAAAPDLFDSLKRLTSVVQDALEDPELDGNGDLLEYEVTRALLALKKARGIP